jgi:DNA-binding HxlR family transcriptional regulator
MTTAPPALAWSTDNCTVGRAMAILGERWTFVVLREVFNGVRRFDEMRTHTGIPRQVLTDRLARLVDAGILRRQPYRPEGQRTRHEYRLTDKGFDLYPVLVAISQWGDRYLADPEGPPVEFAHHECGERVTLTVSCGAGHALPDARSVVPRPSRGARPFAG